MMSGRSEYQRARFEQHGWGAIASRRTAALCLFLSAVAFFIPPLRRWLKRVSISQSKKADAEQKKAEAWYRSWKYSWVEPSECEGPNSDVNAFDELMSECEETLRKRERAR